MSEARIQLSEVAFNAIINAQIQLNNSQQQVQQAQDDLNKVLALVLDGLGLPLDTQISLDPQTKMLIYFTKELPPTPETAPIVKELKKAAAKVTQPKKRTKRSKKSE